MQSQPLLSVGQVAAMQRLAPVGTVRRGVAAGACVVRVPVNTLGSAEDVLGQPANHEAAAVRAGGRFVAGCCLVRPVDIAPSDVVDAHVIASLAL